MKRTHWTLAAIALSITALGARAAVGFRPTSHDVEASTLGAPSRGASLEAVVDEPGPLTVESVVGADWAVPRSGLINLDHPAAKEAGLVDGDEAIVVELHAIRHPTRGLFLVDTGVERSLRDDAPRSAMTAVVRSAMHVEKMRFRSVTSEWLATQPDAPAGVFLTHLHLDHVSGLRDVPEGTPVWVGPGEATTRSAMSFFVQRSTDRALEGKPALREWGFRRDEDGAFEGVLDVFGDQSLFALWVPGHTAGSTAYLARTTKGPVLFTGDACHTTWGWEHGVEPGAFSEDRPRSAASLARLRGLVARHPRIEVRVGHQTFEHAVAAGPAR